MSAFEVTPWSFPRNYVGATWYGWYNAGFSQHRDSDAGDRTNFQAVLDALKDLHSEVKTDDLDDEDNGLSSVQVVRENHWGRGWIEWIAIHSSNEAALNVARELCERANNYPLLDEDACTALEHQEAEEFWDSLSLISKMNYCKDCGDSIFAARRSYWDLPQATFDHLRES